MAAGWTSSVTVFAEELMSPVILQLVSSMCAELQPMVGINALVVTSGGVIFAKSSSTGDESHSGQRFFDGSRSGQCVNESDVDAICAANHVIDEACKVFAVGEGTLCPSSDVDDYEKVAAIP
jgi:hypothetical protein